jgi:hypothetical protein
MARVMWQYANTIGPSLGEPWKRAVEAAKEARPPPLPRALLALSAPALAARSPAPSPAPSPARAPQPPLAEAADAGPPIEEGAVRAGAHGASGAADDL